MPFALETDSVTDKKPETIIRKTTAVVVDGASGLIVSHVTIRSQENRTLPATLGAAVVVGNLDPTLYSMCPIQRM